MKVLLVNGSPHEHGSTARALQEVSKTLMESGVEAEIFWIGNQPIGGCIGCGGCGKKGECVFGGVVAEFGKLAKDADGFVFGSPVHYAAASGNMTSFMDRLFYSAGENLRFKPAAVVTAARRGGNTATYEQLLNCQEAIYYRKRTQVPVTPETLSYAYVSYRDPAAAGDPDYNYYMENLNLTPEEAYELYSECILPDIDDGTLGRVWLIMDDDYYNTVYDCSISLELRQPGNEGTRYDYFYTVPTVDSTRTNAWLTEHGVSLEFYDYYEQKDPSIETVSRVSATDIVID